MTNFSNPLRQTDDGEDNETQVVDDLVERISDRVQAEQLQGAAEELIQLLAPAAKDDELGRLGGYCLRSVIGVGGMGVVFAAEDLEMERDVAIKAMKPVLAASPSAAQRFQREARAAATFQHDRIVTIYQVGEDRGIPFFTMQRLEGESLGARLTRVRKLSSSAVVDLAIGICEGLAAAHERGLLHRDIKPDNIWLQAEDDSVKILDFGLVRSIDSDTNLTNSGAILGTPRYMSPEQAQGMVVDARSDLFSLGSVLYHAATGQTPFAGGNVVSTLVAVSNSEIQAPHEVDSSVPAPLSRLIMRLLEKEAEQRPASVTDVLEELREIRAGKSPQLPPKSPRGWANGVGWAVAAIAILMLSLIVLVQTNRGTLVIEASDGVTVEVEKQGVWLRDAKTGKKLRVSVGTNRLKSGSYELVVSDGSSGWQYSAESFTLRRGDERRVVVSLRPKKDAGGPSSATTGLSAKPPSSPLELGSRKNLWNVRAGERLFQQALVQSPAPLPNIRSWTWTSRNNNLGVSTIAANPKLPLLALGDAIGQVRILELPGGEVKHILPANMISTTDLCWSPDGRVLISAHHEGDARRNDVKSVARIWKIESDSARLLHVLNVDARRIAWSPDGKHVAFNDSSVQLLDATSSVAAMLPNSGIEGQVSRQPWSPDGQRIVTHDATDGLRIWDVASRRMFHSFNLKNTWEGKWHQEGRYLAFLRATNLKGDVRSQSRSLTADFSIEIWDMETLRSAVSLPLVKSLEFTLHTSQKVSDMKLAHFAWSPDGKQIATVLDGKVDVWDVASQKRKALGAFDLKGRSVSSWRQRWKEPQWSADGKSLYLLSATGDITRWNVADGKRRDLQREEIANYLFASTARGNRIVLGRVKGREAFELGVWDLARRSYVIRHQRKLSTGDRSDGPFSEFSLSPDGQWLLDLRQDVKPSDPPPASDRNRGFRSNYRYLPKYSNYEAFLIDATNGKTRSQKFEAPAHLSGRWSRDSQQVAVAGMETDGAVTLLFGPQSQEVKRLKSKIARAKGLSPLLAFQVFSSPQSHRFDPWFGDGKRLMRWYHRSGISIQNLETGNVVSLRPRLMEKEIEAMKNRDRSRPRTSFQHHQIEGAVASPKDDQLAVLVTRRERVQGRMVIEGTTVELWDLSPAEPKFIRDWNLKPLTYIVQMRFSADGKMLSFIGNNESDEVQAAHWNTDGTMVGEPLTLPGGDSYGLALAFGKNGYLVNGDMSHVRVLDNQGQQRATYFAPQTTDSDQLPPIFVLSPRGDYDTVKNGSVFEAAMVFVGLTQDGRVVTRTPEQAKREFGFQNQPIELEKLKP